MLSLLVARPRPPRPAQLSCSYCRLPPMLKDIRPHREEDERANHDPLEQSDRTDGNQRVVHGLDQERAQNATEDCATATQDAGASNDGGSNSLQLEPNAGIRLHGAALAELDQGGQPNQKTDHGVDEYGYEARVYARQACCFGIAPQRIDGSAQRPGGQKPGEDDEKNHHDPPGSRQTEKGTQRQTAADRRRGDPLRSQDVDVQGADYVEGTERHDDGVNAPVRHDDTVGRADDQAGEKGGG